MQFLFGTDLPLFQVWRPTSSNSAIYTKIGEAELPLGDRIGGEMINYYFIDLSLNSSKQIEFHSGDVIGYYQSTSSHRIRNIRASGYTYYSNRASSPLTSIDVSNTDYIETHHQPLIEVMFGKVYIYRIKHSVYTYVVCSMLSYVYSLASVACMHARSQKILLGSAFEEKVDLLILQNNPGAGEEFNYSLHS